ncbi:hypothetical protein BU17DRAFT_56432 [Hysterangium stoloniferum]|nr:hypothetical protein BU17DRAFT_56432 [Hysterangium stoloniferum]
MPPRTDRKRSATSLGASNSNVKKRTRFASPDAEPANFAAEVDASLENPSAARKGRVKVEGYDSDSSDDGEGVVESRKKRTKAGDGDGDDDDEDEDMFAVGEKDDKATAAAATLGKKKKKEFMRLGDIEGQEFHDRGSAEDSSSESDEPEDEDAAEARRRKGMGFEMSKFNMREEMEEGKFDADGTFVRTFDPHSVHDRWMDGVDEREMKRAKKSKRMREREEKERVAKEDRDAVGREEAERELVAYLHRGESVLEALQRLGVAARKGKAKSKQKQHKTTQNGMDVDSSAPITATTRAPAPIQDSITRITDLASILMSQGNTDIYSATYEQLLRSVRSGGTVAQDWVPPSQNAQFEYRWAVHGEYGSALPADDAGHGPPQIYGPYKTEEMQAWHGAKYFGDEGEKVRVRKVGENNWHEWDDVMF